MPALRSRLRFSLPLAAIVTTALLLGIWAYGLGLQRTHPISVGVAGVPSPRGGHVQVDVSIVSHRPFPVPVQAALLPEQFLTNATNAYVLVDPSLPSTYGTTLEAAALAATLGAEMRTLGSSTTVATMGIGELGSFLRGNESAMLVIANYGALPAGLPAHGNGSLAAWLSGGGRLVWAGGPLGYYAAPANGSSGAPLVSGPGWSAETALVGFPLTDIPRNTTGAPGNASTRGPGPGVVRSPLPLLALGPRGNGSGNGSSPPNVLLPPASGPLTGSNASPFATGMGFEYNGTEYGANVTELAAHHGISLGFATTAGPNGSAPRTSLAYVPIGRGGLFYFGGAVYDPFGNYVPEGGIRLAFDIGQLLAFPFVPQPGPTQVQYASLPAYGQTSIVFTATTASGPVGLLVQCDAGNSVLDEVAEQLAPGPA